MKLTNKQTFIVKITLGIMFAINAGGTIGYSIASVSIAPFIFPYFIHSFCYLTCVLIIQWILLSSYFPKQWFLSGLVGCLISAILVQTLTPLSPFNPPNIRFYLVDAFLYLLMGLVAVIPQWILLGKQGYLWALLNAVGWALNHIYTSLLIYPIFSVVPFYVVIFITVTNGLLLGLLLSLFLYKVVNGEHEHEHMPNIHHRHEDE